VSRQEVAPGVLVVDTRIADGKIGVIAGAEIALTVDTGIDEAEGAAVLAAARSLERGDIRLVYTHGHYDHVLGSGAFRGLPIYARSEVPIHMRRQLPAFAKMTGSAPQELDASLGWPTDTFDGQAELDLGGRKVRFIDTPGHAPGSACVYDADAGVLFGGDTVVTAIPPAFSDGNGVALAATLRSLATLDCEILIPGHGDVITGCSRVRAALEWSAEYLERCRIHIEAMIDRDADAIVSSAPYDSYVGDHLPRDRHRMEWRHEQTIRMLHAQLTENWN
jgi:glyoxylase-like metal-dependent hydrolase (beta-lactamase superfamily II)